MYSMECSLPKDISPNLRVVVCEDETKDVLERCHSCGFFKIKPPRACIMRGKTVMCTYIPRQDVVLSEKSGIFEEKFEKHTSAFREAALKLRRK